MEGRYGQPLLERFLLHGPYTSSLSPGANVGRRIRPVLILTIVLFVFVFAWVMPSLLVAGN